MCDKRAYIRHYTEVRFMGPIADVVNAIALGAVVGMKDTATRAVKDSYSGLKSIIQRKYRQVPLAQLEEQPKSEICKKMSEDALEAADALKDAELLRSAQALLDVLMRMRLKRRRVSALT
jgi:phosphoribosyl-ATP pyrophosphohydrolase